MDQHKHTHGKHGQHGSQDHPIRHEHGKREQHEDHEHHEGHGHHAEHGPESSPEDRHAHRDHGHHDHSHMIGDFKRRFWISLILTLPVLALSQMIQQWLGFEFSFPGDRYVLLGLSSVIFFYGGWPFLTGLVNEVRSKSAGMMTLIAVAITVAYVYSTAVVFGLEGIDFFWELATLIVVMLLGHWIEMKSVMGASRALGLLVEMMPSQAHLVKGDEVQDVRLEDVSKGDLLLVKPGEKVPADGVITEGESHLNESMLTGESKPVRKTKGDKVIGGAINGNQSLKIEVHSTGKDSYLSKVINLVQEAQEKKSRTQHLADKAAFWLTVIALTLGSGVLVAWLLAGRETAFAVERAVTVMIISCPHALGLAIPLVVAISTAISANNGLLIRNRTAFENAGRITTLIFDKTGTLTKGKFGVTRYESLDEARSQEELLSLAAALEQNSEHPIAAGILAKAKELGLKIPSARDFNAITGKGVEASVSGIQVKVVSPGYLKEKQITAPETAYSDAAETIVFVIIDDRLAGFIALADEVREQSKEAVKTLQNSGIKAIMLTGDDEKVARSVSEKLGMDGYFAGVLPDEKLDKIKELQEKGEYVAMTGDGVNDAPALAQADIGIAVGSGTDIAAETADIILVNSDPKDVSSLILFGKATYRKMVQNLAWATGYNAIALPLATGFIPGIVISPAVGAVLMSLSTVIVAINAQLLKGSMKRTLS